MSDPVRESDWWLTSWIESIPVAGCHRDIDDDVDAMLRQRLGSPFTVRELLVRLDHKWSRSAVLSTLVYKWRYGEILFDQVTRSDPGCILYESSRITPARLLSPDAKEVLQVIQDHRPWSLCTALLCDSPLERHYLPATADLMRLVTIPAHRVITALEELERSARIQRSEQPHSRYTNNEFDVWWRVQPRGPDALCTFTGPDRAPT